MRELSTQINQETGNEKYVVNKLLSTSKYPVLLVTATSNNTQCAVKIYSDRSNTSTIFEKELAFLSILKGNDNIINVMDHGKGSTWTVGDKIYEDSSYLVLDYASHGDLLEIVSENGAMPETLARTLFIQLLDSLSVLHSNKIAHLDLKLENILIDDKMKLRLTDFDLSQSTEDMYLESRGTLGYRAPEVRDGSCSNFISADIYSAGVILFILLSGIPPYTETQKLYNSEYDQFYRVMRNNNSKFWQCHAKFHKNANYFSREFISLINLMLNENSNERISLEAIKSHPWCLQKTFDSKDYCEEMSKYLSCKK